MKLIKEFTRQCCNALQGVSSWPAAISEVVEVFAHEVCASVCGQHTTVSQEKCCIMMAVHPGRKLAAMRGPELRKVCAYSSLRPKPCLV